MCSVRSLPRVGHGVGQHRRQHRYGATISVKFDTEEAKKSWKLLSLCTTKEPPRRERYSYMVDLCYSVRFLYGAKCRAKPFIVQKRRFWQGYDIARTTYDAIPDEKHGE